MTVRFTGLIASCEACPNYTYDTGRSYKCRLVDEKVHNGSVVEPFCPLPIFPSREIVKELYTREMYQAEEKKLGLHAVILRHLSAISNTPVDNFWCITFKIANRKELEEVVLRADNITSIFALSGEVHFTYKGSKFKALQTNDGFALDKVVVVNGKELTLRLTLA